MRTPNLNERIFNHADKCGDDFVIICGSDAFMGNLFADIMDPGRYDPLQRYSGKKGMGSIHRYRMNNGFYDVRNGFHIMGKKSAKWYADAFADMYTNKGYKVMGFCRYDIRLMTSIVEKLEQHHNLRARVYFGPPKLGFNGKGDLVYNSPESGDNE